MSIGDSKQRKKSETEAKSLLFAFYFLSKINFFKNWVRFWFR